ERFREEKNSNPQPTGPDDDRIRTRASGPRTDPLCRHPVRHRLQQLHHADGCHARRRPQGGREPPGRQPQLGRCDCCPELGKRPYCFQALGAAADLHVELRGRRHGHGLLPLLDQPSRPRREVGSPLEYDNGAGRMNARARNEGGQAVVLTVVFLAVLLGMAALVLDFGSWYRADRSTQSTADSAALAGAQALPGSTSQAASLASSYATKNGGGLSSVSFSASYGPNDTIQVAVKKSAPGIFSKLFGVNSVNGGSKATARTALMLSAKYVAPIVVNKLHPKLLGTPGCPCFGDPSGNKNITTIPLSRNGAPGAFDLLNLDGSHGGTSGGILASWMLKGYDGYLNIGQYYSDPGAKWDDNQLHDALTARIGT